MRRCKAIIFLFAALLSAVLVLAPALGAAAANLVDAEEVGSASDVSHSDLGDFLRVPMVPMNVEIPEFYQEVVNISGMYIFIMPDGTVYKRIYGALDGVYGWYEPVGPDNLIYEDAKRIDPEDDRKLYYDAGGGIDPNAKYMQDYAGILKPDEGVTTVVTVFGAPLAAIFVYCAGAVLLLCIVILISSKSGASHSTRIVPYITDEDRATDNLGYPNKNPANVHKHSNET